MAQVTITVRTDAELKSVIGKKEDTRQEFGDMLQQMLAKNRKIDRPELTLDEINAEIAATRAGRKA